MAAELLYIDEMGTLGFGDYTLDKKAKVEDFEFQGDLYKVKTYIEMTKLEKNGMFLYESVRGTTVQAFAVTEAGLSCQVLGCEDVQVTVELEPRQEYKVIVAGVEAGIMSTNMSGKLSVSIALEAGVLSSLEIMKC